MSNPLLRKVFVFVSGRRWRLLMYVGLLAIAFTLERSGEHPQEENGSMSEAARATYQRVSTLGYVKPGAHFTALVLLDDDPTSQHDPPSVAHNGCERRLYLAKLVQALEVQRASVIVLDFYFDAECPAQDRVLSDTISNTARHVPVVLGQDSKVVSQLRQRHPTDFGPGIDDGDLVPTPPRMSNAVVGATYGLTMLAADTRRIPLRWTIATPASGVIQVTERRVQDSLSLTAAIAHESSLLNNPRLNDYLNRGEFPMSLFVSPNMFPQQTGLDLLCNGQDRIKWQDCNPKQALPNIFNGHIAVIAFGSPSKFDMHDSVLGFVPGGVLQANYIESILSGHYLTQAWWPIQVALSFLCFAAIEVVFEFIPNIWRALLSAVFVTAIFYVICFVAVVEFGYYLDLWIPSALALLLKIVSTLQSWVKPRVA